MGDQGIRPADLRNFGEVLTSRSVERAERTAFVFLDNRGEVSEQLSYYELDRRARAVACELIHRELCGKRVLLLYPTGADFVTALFACFHAGAVAVPMPYTAGKRTGERLLSIYRDSRPAAALTLSTLPAAHDLRSHDAEERMLISWIYTDLPLAAVGNPAAPVASREGLALLQYTSGSIGTPKGVMLTHDNLLSNSAMIARAFHHDENLRGVGWLPLFHDMGLVGHVLQPVFVGGLSVLMSPLAFLQRPSRWLEAISTWRATTSGGPSHSYAMCLRTYPEAPAGLDLSSWKVAYCGSERVRGDVLESFAERFAACGFDARALQPCYGLAEATLLATSGAPGEGLRYDPAPPAGEAGFAPHRIVNCGRQWGDGSVQVIDVETGAEKSEGEVGEVCIAGPNVGMGYWGRPAESAATFRPDGGRRLLRTGDLGYLRGGELYLLGRIKDIIVVFGLKHAAEDIELSVATSDVLFDRLPAAAFAIDDGQAERAVVVQEVPPRNVDTAELARASRNAAAAVVRDHNLRLDKVVLVKAGSLPRTSSGKVQRARARQIFSEGEFDCLNIEIPAKPAGDPRAGGSMRR